MKTVLSWSRDEKGRVINRHPTDICNAITGFAGGGYGNTTPYVMQIWNTERISHRTASVLQKQ